MCVYTHMCVYIYIYIYIYICNSTLYYVILYYLTLWSAQFDVCVPGRLGGRSLQHVLKICGRPLKTRLRPILYERCSQHTQH